MDQYRGVSGIGEVFDKASFLSITVLYVLMPFLPCIIQMVHSLTVFFLSLDRIRNMRRGTSDM